MSAVNPVWSGSGASLVSPTTSRFAPSYASDCVSARPPIVYAGVVAPGAKTGIVPSAPLPTANVGAGDPLAANV